MQLRLSIVRPNLNPVARVPRTPVARVPRTPVKTYASLQPYEVVGHSVVYFTMFYCGMNWWHYRSIRKQVEKLKDSEDASDKKDPKN
jgi:hypothetical protein